MTQANTDGRSPTHYKTNEKEGKQHWDRAWELYREAWFVLNITKYVERYRGKNGIKDLEKARHYLDKLIELETQALTDRQVEVVHYRTKEQRIMCCSDTANQKATEIVENVTCIRCNAILQSFLQPKG